MISEILFGLRVPEEWENNNRMSPLQQLYCLLSKESFGLAGLSIKMIADNDQGRPEPMMRDDEGR